MTRTNKLADDLFGEFEDMSELVDAAIDRVDLVGKAANGHRFILAKSGDSNLFPSDMVRDFIKMSQEETMSDSTVIKADDPNLDVTEVMAEPVLDVKGDEDVPGSSAWEAVDAATANKWTAILARAKNAICELAEREKAELDAGAEDDEDGLDDLKDAIDSVNDAIALLAPFAVNETAEAEMPEDDDLAGIEKAAKSIRNKALSTLEAFAPLVKAGRVLSAENEALVREANISVRKALAELPSKRVAAVETVVKADDLSTQTTEELARTAITGMDAERKEALQELGLRSLTAPAAPAAAEPAPVAAEPVPEDAPDSTEPAPADEVGTPADTPEKPAEPAPAEAAPAAPAEAAVKPEDKDVKKALASQEEAYETLVKSLEARIAHLEAPAPARVLTNGALPPAHLMRGQDAGAAPFGNAEMLRKQLDDAPDAVTKSDASEQMRLAALDALSALRNR